MAHELRQAGWPLARALRGGWTAWQALGLPVEQREEDLEPADVSGDA